MAENRGSSNSGYSTRQTSSARSGRARDRFGGLLFLRCLGILGGLLRRLQADCPSKSHPSPYYVSGSGLPDRTWPNERPRVASQFACAASLMFVSWIGVGEGVPLRTTRLRAVHGTVPPRCLEFDLAQSNSGRRLRAPDWQRRAPQRNERLPSPSGGREIGSGEPRSDCQDLSVGTNVRWRSVLCVSAFPAWLPRVKSRVWLSQPRHILHLDGSYGE